MSELKVVAIPVGRVPLDEIEAALVRVSKVINRPLELRKAARLPQAAIDTPRNQYEARAMLQALRRQLAGLEVAKLIGAMTVGSPVATPDPDVSIFITDVEPKDFKVVTMDGYLARDVVEHVRRVIDDERYRNDMIEHNYEQGKAFFSYSVLRRKLRVLLSNVTGIEAF